MKIINMFRMDRTNAGDWFSPPFRYFPDLGDITVEINSTEQPKERCAVIMGGGGLISPKAGFQRLRRFHKKHLCIGWGLGENWHDEKGLGYCPPIPQTFPDYLKDFDLLGIRDRTDNHRHVPCASCMHPAFEESYRVKRRIGIYVHKRIPLATEGHPLCSNDGADIAEKIRFLGESEIVVTNSYHGLYWALLLNRRVIAVPFGSKFFGFGLPIEFRAPWDLRLDQTGGLASPPGYLEYCRTANREFHLAVMNHINSTLR